MQLYLLLYAASTALAHLTQPPLLERRHVFAEPHTTKALQKRQAQCDQSLFFCPTGTCFTDPNGGYIGCCSVSSCAPRTNCIEYNSKITTPCDINTGGCLYCSDKANPHCVVITNDLADQWILYCGTVATTETVEYENFITTGSQWWPPTVSAVSMTSATPTSSSAVPSSSSTNAASTSSSSTSAVLISSTNSQVSPSPSIAASSTSTSATVAGVIPADVQSPDTSSPSGATIGGIVTGSVVGVAAFSSGLWFFWLRSKNKKKKMGPDAVIEKDNSENTSSAPSGNNDDPAEAEGSMPKPGASYYSPDGIAHYHEADSRPVSMHPHPAVRVPINSNVDSLGIASAGAQSRYRISNPDTPSAETPGNRDSFVVSPLISQECSTPSEMSASTPRTPGTSRYYNTDVVYSPSVYSSEPPGSISQTSSSRPPSLPQPYSTATLATERQRGLYRGLSGLIEESSPPWAYLSAEDAVNGGWKNVPEKEGLMK